MALVASCGFLFLLTLLISLGLPHDATASQFHSRSRTLIESSTSATLSLPPLPINSEGFIYVYNLPHRFNQDLLEADPSCETSKFAAEVTLHKYLLSSPFRTHDPSKASFFYVPLYSTCALVAPHAGGGNPHNYQVGIVKSVLLWLEQDSGELQAYWHRKRGADHIFAFTHDFGGCLDFRDHSKGVPETVRGIQHAVFVQANGDFAGSCYSPHKDIVIPAASPFDVKQIQSIMKRSNAAAGGDDKGKTQKRPLPFDDSESRPSVYFRGTVEWQWMGRPDPSYSRGVRQKLQSLYGRDPRFTFEEGSVSTRIYTEELLSHTFCLCPLGYATWSPRLIDSVVAGCIPVIIGDSTNYPFSNLLDYSKFAVRISETDAVHPGRLIAKLSQYTAEQVEVMQSTLRSPIVRFFLTYVPTASTSSTEKENKDYLTDLTTSLVSLSSQPIAEALTKDPSCGACAAFVLDLLRRRHLSHASFDSFP